ncbi:MAG TPA: DNA methyltransferase, partial [Blastocatellia bacterium]|nr:DNA methyltransferase [Blastocatellia bacterium]
LGKYIPQLVEIFLRKFTPKVVCDPFAGSGTTLVEAAALGIDSVGCDISAFNCLLAKVKTDEYNLEKLGEEIRDILYQTSLGLSPSLFSEQFEGQTDSVYLNAWFAPQALRELLCFRSLIPRYEYQDVMKIILSRSARSARLTTHFNLDFPKKPQTEPYDCYKHGRTCQPTKDALQFLNRYGLDTLKRIQAYSQIRKRAKVKIINGDSRTVRFPKIDAVMTSPPYVGLIDYHEQHRYAYELLELPVNEASEIGAASNGSSKRAQGDYVAGIAEVFANVRKSLGRDGVVVIVVHDKNGFYERLAPQLGFKTEEKLLRHVNRRTGRRATEFYEEILIWRLNG